MPSFSSAPYAGTSTEMAWHPYVQHCQCHEGVRLCGARWVHRFLSPQPSGRLASQSTDAETSLMRAGWMLDLKNPSKVEKRKLRRRPIERPVIDTRSEYDRKKIQKKRYGGSD